MNRYSLIVKTTLITALCIGGSFVAAIYIPTRIAGNFLTQIDQNTINAFLISSFLIFPFIGGWIWGLSLAKLLQVKTKHKAYLPGVIWMLSVFLSAAIIPLGLGQVPFVVEMFDTAPSPTIALSFGVFAGLSAAVNMWGSSRWLGLDNLKLSDPATVGFAAFLGFVLFHGLMHLFGWRIGDPLSRQAFKMTTVLMISGAGSALVAGAVMGRAFLKGQTND